jgi:rubredoxin
MTEPPAAAATLPPYSGLEPVCPKCGWVGATLQYRPARGPLVLPWNPDVLVDVARPERLARHCTSCGYHWDEAPWTRLPPARTPTPTRARPTKRAAPDGRPRTAGVWGDGKTVAADGSQIDTWEDNWSWPKAR